MLTRRRMIVFLGSSSLVAAVSSGKAGAVMFQHPVLSEYAPLRIAIPPFVADTATDNESATDVAQIICDNLKRSREFVLLDHSTFAERITDFDRIPAFVSWKPLDALVTGKVAHQDDGRLKVQFRLWDVASGQQLAGQQYTTSPDYWRRIAHIISDQIYTRMTGEKGYFDSRVVFVAQSGPRERRISRLALMDQDGANVRYLTGGTEAVAQPCFSPQNQKVCYTQFGQGDPEVYLFDVETGQRQSIDNLPGAPLCTPRFSPDGKRLVMSLVKGDRANLFVTDLESKLTTPLTDTPAIDTSPSYSPDGSQICFESDRGGRPQIYVMPANGRGAERISFGGGSYERPVWSPCGNYIAFTKRGGGQIAIGIMKTDGSGERILTAGYHNDFHNEGPTFSPNDRVVMFFRNSGGDAGPSLYSIDISGRNELKVSTPGFASDPAWSPLLS
jgi:TolB protein